MDLTLAEAAAHLRRNTEVVRRWMQSRRLLGYKRVGRWFVDGAALAQFQRREPVRRTWSPEARLRAARSRSAARRAK